MSEGGLFGRKHNVGKAGGGVGWVARRCRWISGGLSQTAIWMVLLQEQSSGDGGPMPKSYSDILANYEQGCWMTVWTGILQYVICPGILSVD